MSPLCRHRHAHILTLLVVLFAAASDGDPAGDTYNCQPEPSPCGHLSVRYPFHLSNSTQEAPTEYGEPRPYCGYPGLAIHCDDDKPVLRLDRDDYEVSAIDYTSLTVSLADADVVDDSTSCPTVRHNVTVPNPFHLPTSTVTYLFFFIDCGFGPDAEFAPRPLRKPPGIKPPGIKPITCGSTEAEPTATTMSFVLPEREVPPKDWWRACQSVYSAPVLRDAIPVDVQGAGWRGGGYAKALRGGFQVGWDPSSGPCGRCEQSSGKCGYSSTGGFLGCMCANGALVGSDVCSEISESAAALSGSKNKNTKVIAGVGAAAGVLLVAGVIAIIFVRKRKQRKVVNSSSKLLKYSGSSGTPTRSRGGDMESGTGSSQDMGSRFSYEELEEATDSFNENRELGDGGFGTVYKGYLVDGRVVAVKRLYNNSYRRVEQFVNEAAILARLRHPNLVMFYGCTSKESRELLLVYEFVQNGTVADHLHGHRAAERALPWPLRLNIAIESAAALTYLHAIEPPIVHRDVKTNNILLDTDFHVKVADFGLSRLFPLDATHVSTAPQGTPGYVDPEYHQCYQLTDKSDVYSFGVVLVELISSKPAVDITRQRNEINLAGMAINRIQKCQLEQLVDLELGYESDPATRKMMTMVAELAFRCLQQNGEMRPPIKEVHDVLRAIKDGSVAANGGGKDKDLDVPLSPDTVHAPWDSRNTTPNTSH